MEKKHKKVDSRWRKKIHEKFENSNFIIILFHISKNNVNFL